MSRILLVSQDDEVGADAVAAFRSLGRLVLRLDSVEAVMEQLADEPVDLVVVDTDASCAVGRELVRRLRSDDDPAVAWTGTGVASGLGLVFAEVPDAVLAPPVTMAGAGAMLTRLEREGARYLSPLRELTHVDGPLEHFPPLRVLWAAQLSRATGRLELYIDEQERELFLKAGRIIEARGFPELLQAHGITVGPEDGLEAAVGKAVAAGVRPDLALDDVAVAIGEAVAGMVGRAGGMVFFDAHADPPARAVPLSTPVPRLLAKGMARARPVDAVRRILAPLRSNRFVAVTDSFGPGGLPPHALRLWRAAQEGPSLGEVVGDDDADWQAADLLLQLGLARLEVHMETTPQAHSARGGGRVRAPRADTEPVLEPEIQQRLQELTDERRRLRDLDAPGILGITQAAELESRTIEERFRLLSSRFHPDRYIGDGEAVGRVARDCFSLVNDAAAVLRDPQHLFEIRKRYEFRERGEVYVSDSDRRRARMHFVAGEAAFRRKQLAAAQAELERAHEADPSDWRTTLLLARTWFDSAARPPEECAEAIAELQPPEGRARSEFLGHLGEMWLAAGDESRAWPCFELAASEWQGNVEAKRRLRLRRMRTEGVDAVRAADEVERSRRADERAQDQAVEDRRKARAESRRSRSDGGDDDQSAAAKVSSFLGGLFKRTPD